MLATLVALADAEIIEAEEEDDWLADEDEDAEDAEEAELAEDALELELALEFVVEADDDPVELEADEVPVAEADETVLLPETVPPAIVNALEKFTLSVLVSSMISKLYAARLTPVGIVTVAVPDDAEMPAGKCQISFTLCIQDSTYMQEDLRSQA